MALIKGRLAAESISIHRHGALCHRGRVGGAVEEKEGGVTFLETLHSLTPLTPPPIARRRLSLRQDVDARTVRLSLARLAPARLGPARPDPLHPQPPSPPHAHLHTRHLGDFSQSRLPNQLSNAGREGESSTFSPCSAAAADKSALHQHSRQVAVGRADTRGLNPKPRPPPPPPPPAAAASISVREEVDAL